MSDYFEERGDTKGLARVALRRMEHFYYKTDAVYDAMRKLAVQQQQAANLVQVPAPARPLPVLSRLLQLWSAADCSTLAGSGSGVVPVPAGRACIDPLPHALSTPHSRRHDARGSVKQGHANAWPVHTGC